MSREGLRWWREDVVMSSDQNVDHHFFIGSERSGAKKSAKKVRQKVWATVRLAPQRSGLGKWHVSIDVGT